MITENEKKELLNIKNEIQKKDMNIKEKNHLFLEKLNSWFGEIRGEEIKNKLIFHSKKLKKNIEEIDKNEIQKLKKLREKVRFLFYSSNKKEKESEILKKKMIEEFGVSRTNDIYYIIKNGKKT